MNILVLECRVSQDWEGVTEHVKTPPITIGHRMFWGVIEVNSLIRPSDMTRSRFCGNITGYCEEDKVKGKGT